MFWLKRNMLVGSYRRLDRRKPLVVRRRRSARQLVAVLAVAREVEVDPAIRRARLEPLPERRAPRRCSPRPRRRSSQIESIEHIQGIERSPNAVASAGDAAVAPPKFQIEDSVFGDGGAALPAHDHRRSRRRRGRAGSGSSSSSGAGRTGSRRRTAAGRRSRASGRRSRRPARPARAAAASSASPSLGIAGEAAPRRCRRAGPRRPPGSPGSPGSSRTRPASRRVRCLSARKSRQKRIGPGAGARSGRSAPRTSPSGRPGAARTRSRSRRRSCRRRRAAPRTGRRSRSALARSDRPSAVTTSADTRLSMHRP